MMFRKPYRVICVGSAAKDVFMPTDEGVILETPDDLTCKRKVLFEVGGKYRVPDRYEAVGGVAANVAQALAKLGIRASVMSRIGNDEIGRWILATLRRKGVGTDAIVVDPAVSSDLSTIVVLMGEGERVIFHNRDANERLTIDPHRFEGAEWVFVSSLNGDWGRNIREAFDGAERSGLRVAFNPGQHNIRSNASLILEMAGRSDIVLLNKDEAIELLSGTTPEISPENLDDETYLVRSLQEHCPGIVSMTDGIRGAWAYDGHDVSFEPAIRVEAVLDTTGAGDAFAAVFFAGTALLGMPIRDAMRLAVTESASVVSTYGASEGHLSLDELRHRASRS